MESLKWVCDEDNEKNREGFKEIILTPNMTEHLKNLPKWSLRKSASSHEGKEGSTNLNTGKQSH